VWNRRRPEFINELASPDCLAHHPDGETRDIAMWRSAIYEADARRPPGRPGDGRGGHRGRAARGRTLAVPRHSRGDGLGIPPTGRPIEMSGMTWLRFDSGCIVEGWDC